MRSGRTDEEKISAGVRERGTLSSVWFGSHQRETALGVLNENTINYPLCYSGQTQDYHPRYIHHIKGVVCILHTCTAIWKYTGRGGWGGVGGGWYCSNECQPTAINPLCDWEQVQMDLCLCATRCLMCGYEACSNQSTLYTNMIITLICKCTSEGSNGSRDVTFK